MSRVIVPAHMRPHGLDLVEPKAWPYDQGERREPVIDLNFEPARVVRLVGWRPCMRCGRYFFSEDVGRIRLDDYCRSTVGGD